jgi:hypothetical protein
MRYNEIGIFSAGTRWQESDFIKTQEGSAVEQEYPFRPRGRHGFDRDDVINYISQAQLRCNEHLARLEEMESAKQAWYAQAKNTEREKLALVARNRELEEQLERGAAQPLPQPSLLGGEEYRFEADSQELAAVKARCLELEQQLTAEKEKIAALQVAQQEQAADALPAFPGINVEELHALRAQLAQKETETQALFAKLSGMEQENAALTNQLRAMSETFQLQSDTELAAAEEERAASGRRIQALEEERASLQQQLSALQRQAASLAAELAAAQTVAAQAQTAQEQQLAALAQENERLTQEKNQTVQEKDLLAQEKQRLAQSLPGQEERISELLKQVALLEEEKAAYEEQLPGMEEQLRLLNAAAESERQGSAQKLAAVEREKSAQAQQICALERGAAQARQTLAAQQAELEELREQAAQAQRLSEGNNADVLRSMVLASFNYSNLYVENNLKTAQVISDATSRNIGRVSESAVTLLEQLDTIGRSFQDTTDHIRRNLATFQRELNSIQSGMNKRLSADRFSPLLEENERLRSQLESEILAELSTEDEISAPSAPISAAEAQRQLPFADELPQDYHDFLD